MRPQMAVFGGSFDPPHLGHVLLAQVAVSMHDLEQVLVAPAYAHAFGKSMLPFEHRMAMAKLAFAESPRVRVDAIEKQLGGTSLTLRLIEALKVRYPHHDLRLLIGGDILGEAQKWHRFDEICHLAPPIVVGRSGFPHPEVAADAPVLPAISSTEVRTRLGAGEALTQMLPVRVQAYIKAHGLYRADALP